MNRQILRIKFLALAIIALGILAAVNQGQTTQFTYQGRFNDSSVVSPTNGTYEMEFKAFDTTAAGNQFGATAQLPTVQVVNGIFTVQLDFGAATFRGEDRYLEISVRPVGSAVAFTTLAPRQQVTSAPFAIQSFNSRNAVIANDANNLGGLPASDYVKQTDARLSDDRNPTAGSANYVQNQSALVQASTDFNISGSGKADSFNAATQYNIGGTRVLSIKGIDNFFGGVNAGANNNPATASGNTFVGSFSGNANTAGIYNSFFGTDAGRNNQADANAFFGRSSGFANTSGASNSFFGLDSGRFNVAGSNNSFYGRNAGFSNLTDNNSFFGYQAGVGTTTGGNNSFFGLNSGSGNTTGGNNTMLGSGANVTANNLNFATAIGSGALVSTSNTIVLGTASTGTEIPGTLKLLTLGASGATTLCRNAVNQIATCTGGGSGFIQNSTVLQPSADFNISGGGTLGGTLSANVVNSTTTYRIANVNAFSLPNGTSVVIGGGSSNHTLSGLESTFVGTQAGEFSNNLSQKNTFMGYLAGRQNTSGKENTFVGATAAQLNVTGSFNSFFGTGAGYNNNVDGSSYFGYRAGYLNGNGLRNSFFGFEAGQQVQNQSDNSFFGYQSGLATTGAKNSFFGSSSGLANNTGNNNTFLGDTSGSANTSGFRNTFVGSNSGFQITTQSESTSVGFNTGGTGTGNTSVGAFAFGTLDFNTNIGRGSHAYGSSNTTLGENSTAGTSALSVSHSMAIGADASVTTNNTIVIGSNIDTVKIPKDMTVAVGLSANVVTVTGELRVPYLDSGLQGEWTLCITGTGNVYKCGHLGNNIVELGGKFEKQATLIESQQKQLEQQQLLIEGLRKLVCSQNPNAEVCKR